MSMLTKIRHPKVGDRVVAVNVYKGKTRIPCEITDVSKGAVVVIVKYLDDKERAPYTRYRRHADGHYFVGSYTIYKEEIKMVDTNKPTGGLPEYEKEKVISLSPKDLATEFQALERDPEAEPKPEVVKPTVETETEDDGDDEEERCSECDEYLSECICDLLDEEEEEKE
jgi:hypothetical protein